MDLDEQFYVFPDEVVESLARQPLLRGLHICRAGYFPTYDSTTKRPTGFSGSHIMIHCLTGRGWFESAGQRRMIGPGQVLFVLMDEPHAYGAVADDPWTIQWVHFNGTEARTYLDWLAVTSTNPLLTIGEALSFNRLFGEMLGYCRLGYSMAFQLSGANLLRQLLSLLGLGQSGVAGEKAGFALEPVIQHMLLNLGHKMTVPELAATASLSPAHFSRQFRRQTGYAPHDYFIRLKMQKACELLSTTTMPIGAVGRQVGYGDPYYFSRAFKRTMGQSPRAYRSLRQFEL